MQREKGMIRCQVTLLDDSVFTCDVDVSSIDSHSVVIKRRLYACRELAWAEQRWRDICFAAKRTYKFTSRLAQRWLVTLVLVCCCIYTCTILESEKKGRNAR